MRRHLIPALALLFLPLIAQALPAERGAPARHYVLDSAVALDAAASAELAAEGIDVQQPLANHRYLVRMADGISLPHDARIRSLRAYDASHKVARAAYAEAARGKAFAKLRVVFHQDVTFEEAQAAIDAVGGTIDTPFAVASASPQRLTVRIPSAATLTLAADERVFGVYGPPLRPRRLNAFAAQISKVTPLYSAPYSLTGDGVVLSIFEPDGAPDATHLEFGGRLISHFDASRTVDAHATHVSGTIVAAGINTEAKGMSAAATLHAYDANPVDAAGNPDFPKLLQVKTDGPKSVGSVADNNSWDFGLSWQYDPSCPGSVPFCVWTGNDDAYGAYSALESEPYDAIARMTGAPLLVHAAGNDAESGTPSLTLPWSPHKHYNDKTGDVDSGTFCYSQNKTGTDCPTAAPFRCSTGKSTDGQQYCEVNKPLEGITIPHPTHGATTTVGLMGSTKNSITVGALQTDSISIAPFSSRGPTLDGRVKPEIVANGTNQFSTEPNNTYGVMTGTSMATPVVTGIAGLLTQQYRKTFGKTPNAALLKTLLIAGADDLGNPGPDYTFGFGLADAKASADFIVADNGFGSRIRTGTVSNGQDIDVPITLAASQNLRVVLGWFDPEVLLVPDPTVDGDDPLADKTLVNDLDLRVVDPTGNAVLPYVLNGATPSAVATRGVNHTDTTEEVEIANAGPGTYHVIIHGAIGDTRSSSQDYVLVMNGGALVAACTDAYEPNDTQATAWGNVLSGQAVAPKICSASDVDYFTFVSNSTAPIVVNVAAGDTPLKVTLSSSASTTVTQTIAANSSAALTTNIIAPSSPTPNVAFFVRVEPNGAVGATGSYTVTPFYTFVTVPRRRAAKH